MNPSHDNFFHPYQPYPIQHDFMTKLYSCIEQGNVGIFESPTGTGKSLSLICGSLTWLRDHDRQLLNTDDTPDNTDWLLQAEAKVHRRQVILERQELEQRLASIRLQEAKRIQRHLDIPLAKRPRVNQQNDQSEKPNTDEYMLEDYNSDTDTPSSTNEQSGFSAKTQDLLDKLSKPSKTVAEDEETDRLKLIICSRTHSQLTQFVSELRRVKVLGSLPNHMSDQNPSAFAEESVKHLPLSSRKHLCINPNVARLQSTIAINDQCLELQKPGTPKDKKCPYLPGKEERDKMDEFRDRTMAQIRDIEDIGALGREMKTCPYYASRNAIRQSEVLTLPYALLLQKSAREALGVSVKNNIVIIDEAHNLMDAIAETHSANLSLSQLDQAIDQATAYAVRFKNRLKGKNRVYVTQVLRVLNSLVACLRSTVTQMKSEEITVTTAQLMSGKGMDQIKPHKLLQFLHESKLAHKIEGYSESGTSGDTQRPAKHKNVLLSFQNFLAILMNPDDEGRFFVSRVDQDVTVRYTLLNPREHFRDIVREARSVILAGGTMSPMTDYSDYLFPYLTQTQLQTFSFGHVIPDSNLFAQAVTRGPDGIAFDFTYGTRGSTAMMLELGKLVLRVCQCVPDGVVVFFPSYNYLTEVIACWRKSTISESVMTSLERVTTVFQEMKGNSVDDLLCEYATAIDSGRGGLMLSVVGGKLSEGINFADRLGRAVIAVGLPFPNANGAEWKAKLAHVESLQYQQFKATKQMSEHQMREKAKQASRNFYENACMRAVNQSIGRVIRHRNDYAAILMIDGRFATERIQRKLPGWIQSSLRVKEQHWAQIEKELASFFRQKC
ncbi:hypothetical protein B0A52_00901 [Exophiala mesophila]|uniref:ATP-dependent DNA helicase CHL1 n=1 Tax=Exophiala mesophila TaxID=212818 RepID=A0A438NIJ6_EXOME|nr:hypothetical protein B0A52_00901 [Exophiala mesophila]